MHHVFTIILAFLNVLILYLFLAPESQFYKYMYLFLIKAMWKPCIIYQNVRNETRNRMVIKT